MLTKGSAAVLAYLRSRIPEGDAGRYAPALQRLFASTAAASAAATAVEQQQQPVQAVDAPSQQQQQRAPPSQPWESARGAAPQGAGPEPPRASPPAPASFPSSSARQQFGRAQVDDGGAGAERRTLSRAGSSAPPWATEGDSGWRAGEASTAAAAPPPSVGGGVTGGGGGPVWGTAAQAAAPPPPSSSFSAAPAPASSGGAGGPAAAAKRAEHASILARIDELNGDVQRGGMSSTLLAAVRRQLVVLRSNEARLRGELGGALG